METRERFRYTEYPYARVFRDFSTDRGRVVRFVVELQYGYESEFYWPENCDDWRKVARFDHNPLVPDGHDIREEGLHLDIYKGEEEYESTEDFPYVHVDEAPRWCETYFLENLDFLLERYERLNGLHGDRWTVNLRH